MRDDEAKRKGTDARRIGGKGTLPTKRTAQIWAYADSGLSKNGDCQQTSPQTQPAHSLVDNSAKGKNCVHTKNCAENRTNKNKKCHEFCTTYAKIRDINNFKLNLPHVPKEGGETPFLPRERFRANADRALAKRGIHSDGVVRHVAARGKRIPSWLHETFGTDDLADSTDRTCHTNGTTPSCRAGEGKSHNAVSGA